MGASPDNLTLEPGVLLGGRYCLEELIGEGGVGQVYRATHKFLRTPVAIKVLRPRPENLLADKQRFEREAFALGKVAHENCLAVSDFGEHEGMLFLVTELLEGRSLGQLLAQEKRLEIPRAFDILAQLLRALGHAHEQGVIHRDLKPDNIILVDRRGNPEFVKVLDFGLAKLIGEAKLEEGRGDLTQMGVTFGTPRYMAPEQASGGTIDARTDLYAVSVIAYRMLAGRAPFEDEEPHALLMAHCTRVPPTFQEIGVDIPRPIEDLVRRGMSKKAADRFDSARAYLEAMDAALVDVEAGLDPGATHSLRRAVRTGEGPGLATAPTMMAQSPVSPPSAQPSLAAPVVTSGGGDPAMPPSPPTRWRKLLGAVAGIAILGGIAAVAAATARSKPSAAPRAAATVIEDSGASAERDEVAPPQPVTRPMLIPVPTVIKETEAATKDAEDENDDDYVFGKHDLDDVKALVDAGRDEAAIKLLRKKVRTTKYGGRAAFLLGNLYFHKMHWSDGFKAYELAVKRDAEVAKNPITIHNAVIALESRRHPGIAERFIRRHIGTDALPVLDDYAKNARYKHHRDRCARLARSLRNGR